VPTHDDKPGEGRARQRGRKPDEGRPPEQNVPPKPEEEGQDAKDEEETGAAPPLGEGAPEGGAQVAGSQQAPEAGAAAPAAKDDQARAQDKQEAPAAQGKPPSGEKPVVKAVRKAATGANGNQGGNGMAGTYLSPGVYVEEVPSATQPIAGVGTSTAGFVGFFEFPLPVYVFNEETNKFDPAKFPDAAIIEAKRVNDDAQKALAAAPADAKAIEAAAKAKAALAKAVRETMQDPADAGAPKLCTSFTDFKRYFGDFSIDRGQRLLAHAVYGFFRNGGSRCYVIRHASQDAAGADPLLPFEAVDEIAIVAAPGITDDTVRRAVVDHCKKMKHRFAILDTERRIEGNLDLETVRGNLANTSFGAVYFPWISVADPVTRIVNPDGDGLFAVPPSGHVAGIYARVDNARGIHKAPANEVVVGARSTVHIITRALQDGLNPKGVNCLRIFNNNVVVWGARTLGGDDNGEFKYVNVRRTLLYLSKSIDEGTQWTVFEPNDETLWGKIRRNVTAFLLVVWRNGALFGATPGEAFFVKCDAETNPPETRELGMVVCEIGVAIVRPAEFVIFRITQWQGPQKSS
jgi:phage tail sheath protein FI